MSPHPQLPQAPRTDECYDRAEATVSKFRREDLRKQAEVDELDALCRRFEQALTEIHTHANDPLDSKFDPFKAATEALWP